MNYIEKIAEQLDQDRPNWVGDWASDASLRGVFYLSRPSEKYSSRTPHKGCLLWWDES
jgi:hypothetical protein